MPNINTAPILSQEIVEEYKNKPIPWGFNGLGYIVYKRTYARPVEGEDRTEEWAETLLRAINGAQAVGANYTEEEARRLFDYMYNLKGSFAGRMLWQLGTPLIEKIGGPSLLNCWFTNLSSVDDFVFLMMHLALGGGVGFSVERAEVHELPKVKMDVSISHENTKDADFIVPDSREGWCHLLEKVLVAFFHSGKSFTYSTLLVRGYGEKLNTFGGTASGPQVLVDGIQEIVRILSLREGKKLRSIDALDIANVIGKIIVAGSARRSAQIALGDPDDYLFLRAKRWDLGVLPDYRGNSNNSVLADSFDEIIDELWKGYGGNGEAYGLINRKLARKTGRLGEKVNDSKIAGFNPCAEIGLEDGECCNLSEIFLPRIESMDELLDLSKLLYKTQKAITTLDFPFAKTREVVQRNRRLGLGITGWMESSAEQIDWLDTCYQDLKHFDVIWSKEQGLSASIKLTTVKPSGTLSLLAGVTPGIHPGYARYTIRRVRLGSMDPLVKYCQDHGFKTQYDIKLDGKEDHTKIVVDFPCESPNAVLASEISAVEQLEWVVKAQTVWADNAVSCTVYYHKDELPEIKAWLEENYEKKIKSISFGLHEDHGFNLPPYEEIDEATYLKMREGVREIDPMAFNSYQEEGMDLECATGACPIR